MAKDNFANTANLDALLPRADLYEPNDSMSLDVKELRVTDLEPSVTYSLLRKPDFQRETRNWSPEQIVDLIETFCANDIIPAIILWQSGKHIFVVDGCHRVSALIGWVRHDFGAGQVSMAHYGTRISAHQRKIHDQTIQLLDRSVGKWEDYLKDNQLLSMKALQIQWVDGRRPDQAAKAFHRINRGGTVIDPLEARILHAGRSALSIATRVITHGGAGFAYWDRFTDEKARTKCPELGARIFTTLFEPELRVPIKTLDIPLGGRGYGTEALRLAFDVVATVNNARARDSSTGRIDDHAMPPDDDGMQTLNYLIRTSRHLDRILSNEPSSFGFHPAVWCYSNDGEFQPTSLLVLLDWIADLDKLGRLELLRQNRGTIEDMIILHRSIVKPPIHTLGSGRRSRPRAINVLNELLDLSAQGLSEEQIWSSLRAKFKHLATESTAEDYGKPGAPFKASAKNKVTLSSLSSLEKCPLCGGRLHPNGKVLDHIAKRADGGSSAASNGRWVHPICNSNREKDEASPKN